MKMESLIVAQVDYNKILLSTIKIKISFKLGDSGGPLVRASDKMLFGLVSFGNDCAKPGYPGVYAKITIVLDWIFSITSKQY